ncbi:MAG: hypothetical protein ACQERT_11525 [Thermodesulfobacteriota bacterium]
MNQQDPNTKKSLRLSVVVALLAFAIVLTVLITLFVAKFWLFQPAMDPVDLSSQEEAELETKLQVLQTASDQEGISPEPYSEQSADRVIYFTQRELNALIATEPDLARRAAVHLSEDMISANFLVTLPQDLPILAGKTVKVSAGLRVGYSQGRPSIIIKGVSLMGIPVPSAWLGGLKGRDLVQYEGQGGGLWQAFGRGIADLQVKDGRLKVELAD